MVIVKRAPVAASGLLLLAVAALLAVPILDKLVREGVDSAVTSSRARLEDFIGLRISFDSLSPSILRSAAVSNLRIGEPGGRTLLEARKVRFYYDILALVSGDASRAITGLGLEAATLDLRLPEDQELIDRLSVLFSGRGGGAAPRILVTGRGVEASLTSRDTGKVALAASSLNFSTIGEDVELALKGSFSYKGGDASSPEISGPLGIDGSLTKDFSRARLGLSIAANSDAVSLATQRFELVYADGSVELTKVKDKAPVDAEIRYDLASGDVAASLRMWGFAPSGSLRLGAGFDALAPWLSTPCYGVLSLEVPGGDLGALRYSANVSGTLAAGVLGPASKGGEPTRAEIAAEGDASEVTIERARLVNPSMRIEYRGSFRFADLSPDGSLDARLSLNDGRLPIEASLRVTENDGEYSVIANSARAAGVELRDIVVLASRSGESVDFRASMRPPESEEDDAPSARFSGEAGTGGGKLPSVFVEGSAALGKDPGIEMSMDVGELDLAPLVPIIEAATGSPELADFLDDAKVGLELFATSDFKRLSWSAPELTLVSRRKAGTFASLSLAGSDKSLSIKNAVVSIGGYVVKGSGRIDATSSKGLGFEARIDLSDIPYLVKGDIGGDGIALSGDYGLELNAARAGEDTYFGASTRELPIPIAGSVYLVSLDATGRFRDLSDWGVSLSRLDMAPAGGASGDLPKIEVAGALGPRGGTFGTIRAVDAVSSVNGVATVKYSLEGGVDASFEARLEGDAPVGDGVRESYAISAAYDKGALEGAVIVSGSPLARFKGSPVKGLLEGRLDFSGTTEEPEIVFSGRLRDGNLLDQALSLSVSGSYEDRRLTLADASAAYQGFKIADARGALSLETGEGDLSMLVSGSFLGEPFSYALSAVGSSIEEGGDSGPFSAYSVEGTAEGKAAGASPWPFSTRFDSSGLRVRAGGDDELKIDYNADHSFLASLKDPFPLRVSASGTFDGRNVDLVARDLDLDVDLLQALVDPAELRFESGRVTGGFRAYGLAGDPEIEGELYIVNAMLGVPQWIADPIGPINAPILMSERSFGAVADSVPVGRATVRGRAQGVFDHWLPSQLTASIASTGGTRVDLSFTVIGIMAKGEAEIDLKGSLEDDVFHFDVDAAFSSATVVVSPAALGGGAPEEVPAQEKYPVTLDLSANLRFGRGVRVYFPYKDNPVVEGYTEPSSALRIDWDQATGDYAVKGTASLRGGEVFYIQRNFFLKSGKMVFNEETGMFDPRVTLLAELRERNDEGPVLVTLRADNMPISVFKPRLTSDPTMTEAQIAILLGQNLLGVSEDESMDIRKAVISSSEFIPQLNVTRAFENKVRETMGLDILFLRTQVLQRWLIDISGDDEDETGNPLSRYLDSTELYAGKYLSDSIFAYGSISLSEDPLAGSDQLGIDSEFGVELDTPFGLVQWTIAPEHWDDLLISDQSLSLSWKLSY